MPGGFFKDGYAKKMVEVISGGQPGTWTQLGKGPTSIANNATVDVLVAQVLAAGEIPVFHYGMKTVPTTGQNHTVIKPGSVGSANCTGFMRKLVSSGNWEFSIKHNDGGARDFDWQALKVTPA